MRRKSVEELKQLHAAGPTKIYTRLESGDIHPLERIKKYMTPEQAMESMKKAKEAGIEALASFFFDIGCAGKHDLRHITDS